MKIRFTTTIKDPAGPIYHARTEHDLPNEQANHYVQSGIANKTAEPMTGHKPGEVTPGPVKAPDPASQAAADAYRGFDPLPAGAKPLGSGTPAADTTTAIPGAEINPAYVAPTALPSLADGAVTVNASAAPQPAFITSADERAAGAASDASGPATPAASSSPAVTRDALGNAKTTKATK